MAVNIPFARRCTLSIPSTKIVAASLDKTPQADITVVSGAGHVGIPLVLAFAEASLTVNINDLNKTSLATLKSGKLPFIEHGTASLLIKALANNRLIFTSSPAKDTMQLAAFVRNQFGIGHAAMQVNEGLVLHLADDLKRAYDISNMTVGLLGMAFKAEIDDTRSSLSYKIKHTLQMSARKVLTTDPFVTTDPAILPLDDVIEQSDILILCTPHSVYKEADLKGRPVVDVWGFLKNANVVN